MANEELIDQSEPLEGESSEEVSEIEEVVEEKPRDPRVKWYVLHTYSGHENKVCDDILRRVKKRELEEFVLQAVVPTEEETEYKDGKKRTVQRKIYPGYVFIEMILDDVSWNIVRNTRGVTGFVSPDSKPQALPEDEAEKIRQIMRKEKPTVVTLDLRVGQTVRVISGPFQDMHGVIDEVTPEKEKLRVLISLFGRETLVELSYSNVEKLS